MISRSISVFSLLFLITFASPLFSSPDTLLAHFPLRVDASEITGKTTPMVLTNTPFTDSSLYLNGIYYGDGYSVAYTPLFPAKIFKAFTVKVKFKVDTLPSSSIRNESPVLMGGAAWRWMGAIIRSDSTLAIRYNNSYTKTSKTRYAFHTWQEITMTYDSLSSLGILYLNQNPVCSVSFVINYGSAIEASFLTSNYSNGTAFKGYLRDLKIYSGINAPTTDNEKKTNITAAKSPYIINYPNPFISFTQIQYSVPFAGNVKISLYAPSGQEIGILFEKFSTPGNYNISWNPHNIANGVYLCKMQLLYKAINGDIKELLLSRKMMLSN
ncbi:MAG: T9SS type A sorting domain-containing protein [Fibrobacteres bacterium]|nr:T9SS type A sorting domain-containing protein [Fibrobacterota bacterium]